MSDDRTSDAPCGNTDAVMKEAPPCSELAGHYGSHQSDNAAGGFFSWPNDMPNAYSTCAYCGEVDKHTKRCGVTRLGFAEMRVDPKTNKPIEQRTNDARRGIPCPVVPAKPLVVWDAKEAWREGAECTRCNATMTWEGDLPETEEEGICDTCAREVLRELRASRVDNATSNDAPHLLALLSAELIGRMQADLAPHADGSPETDRYNLGAADAYRESATLVRALIPKLAAARTANPRSDGRPIATSAEEHAALIAIGDIMMNDGLDHEWNPAALVEAVRFLSCRKDPDCRTDYPMSLSAFMAELKDIIEDSDPLGSERDECDLTDWSDWPKRPAEWQRQRLAKLWRKATDACTANPEAKE